MQEEQIKAGSRWRYHNDGSFDRVIEAHGGCVTFEEEGTGDRYTFAKSAFLTSHAPLDSAPAATAGAKYDGGKPRWSLMPWDPLALVNEIVEYGAKKYDPLPPDNWKRVENGAQRYFDAMMRHAVAYARGERVDSESGKHHLAHAACCALFALYHDTRAQ